MFDFLFIERNTKVNVKYYCNVLLKKIITEMNWLVKHNEYLFKQDGATAHTAKPTLVERQNRTPFTGAPSLATE